ncbi:MAG TPA: adenosylcobinamide-phosphate synthase CbiB [Acidimicrobiales bacterium]|nr:adenosylcobinamide-phosphate synthase CbiB [Acidimicrobiales bacterium]
MRTRPSGAAAGILLDRALGEPPAAWLHPVTMFGTLMLAVEDRLWREGAGARVAGVAHAAVGLGVGALAGALVRSAAATTYVAVSGRLLHDTALEIAASLDAGDLEGARARLPDLAGRDPSMLGEGDIVRAVVESVAENTVDAIVAPALWGAVLGGAGALGYRAVNTMDSMVGHRSDRYGSYGWASARLDDAAGWLPARATAALTAAVRPAAAAEVWRTVRRDAPAHPSPNAGVAEAAFAAALGVRLGGTNRYGERVEHRPGLGRGRPPVSDDVHHAVRLSRDVSLALAALLAVLATNRRPVRGSAGSDVDAYHRMPPGPDEQADAPADWSDLVDDTDWESLWPET